MARGIFSNIGRLFSTFNKLPSLNPYKEQGVGGAVVYGGFVKEVDNNSNWLGRQKYTTSSQILVNASIVAAGTRHFLNLVSNPKWSVTAANDTARAKNVADFVEEVIYSLDTPWPRVVRKMANYHFYGFGVHEWTAKKRADGKIGLQNIERRPQYTIEQWKLGDTGNIEGVFQRSPMTGQLLGIPRGKFLYLVEDSFTDSPEGLGVFRQLGEPYNRLKQYLQLEAIAFEKDLRGIPIARAPLTAIYEKVQSGELTQAKADELVDALTTFISIKSKQSDTGLLLDSQPFESITQSGTLSTTTPQWGLELLTGTGAGLSELNISIERIQREMARIIGIEHLMMGDRGSGNRALAQDKSRNLYLIVNSSLSDLSNACDADIIKPIMILNGIPENLWPWFSVEDLAFRDVQEVTGALKDMSTAGAVLAPNDPAIDDVRDMIGISRAPAMSPDQQGMVTQAGSAQEQGNLSSTSASAGSTTP